MNVYALKFREKGQKEYKTILIQANSEVDLYVKFEQWVDKEFYDVDRRTVSWAGASIPFLSPVSPVGVIYANLDDLN